MAFPFRFTKGDQISKSKKNCIKGMNKRPNGENRKEIGCGMAEERFAENASFLAFIFTHNMHATARDAGYSDAATAGCRPPVRYSRCRLKVNAVAFI
jgi:hypothetical protein